ncbi:hypothetical protein QBC38DRAFT_540851 [Podospora fimiseda]|uniref:Urea transporter n=1 Tax=Podospora fimiseda TaxID=252190 RepID=A0AAN7H2G6_9PEZI|nr:hypothetical protein QBC38DRAFT_540851 [Podospora fimiseda]
MAANSWKQRTQTTPRAQLKDNKSSGIELAGAIQDGNSLGVVRELRERSKTTPDHRFVTLTSPNLHDHPLGTSGFPGVFLSLSWKHESEGLPEGVPFVSRALGSAILFAYPQLATIAGVQGVVTYALSSALPLFIFAALGPIIRRKCPEGFVLTEWTRQRYGHIAALFLSFMTCVTLFLYMVSELSAVGQVVTLLTGIDGLPVLIVECIITTIYTSLGGFQISFFTDNIQGVMVLGLIVIATVAIGVETKIDTSLIESSGLTKPSLLGWQLLYILPVAILTNDFFLSHFWLRTFASKTDKDLWIGITIAAVACLVIITLIGSTGLIAAWSGVYPGPDLENPVDGSVAFFALLEQLPSWVVGIVLVMVVTLSTAAFDSFQSAMVTTVSNDVFRNRLNIWLIRLGVVLIMVPVVVIAIRAPSILQIYLISDLVSAATIPVLVLGLWEKAYWWRGFEVVVGGLGGLLTVFIFGTIYYGNAKQGAELMLLQQGLFTGDWGCFGAFVAAPVGGVLWGFGALAFRLSIQFIIAKRKGVRFDALDRPERLDGQLVIVDEQPASGDPAKVNRPPTDEEDTVSETPGIAKSTRDSAGFQDRGEAPPDEGARGMGCVSTNELHVIYAVPAMQPAFNNINQVCKDLVGDDWTNVEATLEEYRRQDARLLEGINRQLTDLHLTYEDLDDAVAKSTVEARRKLDLFIHSILAVHDAAVDRLDQAKNRIVTRARSMAESCAQNSAAEAERKELVCLRDFSSWRVSKERAVFLQHYIGSWPGHLEDAMRDDGIAGRMIIGPDGYDRWPSVKTLGNATAKIYTQLRTDLPTLMEHLRCVERQRFRVGDAPNPVEPLAAAHTPPHTPPKADPNGHNYQAQPMIFPPAQGPGTHQCLPLRPELSHQPQIMDGHSHRHDTSRHAPGNTAPPVSGMTYFPQANMPGLGEVSAAPAGLSGYDAQIPPIPPMQPTPFPTLSKPANSNMLGVQVQAFGDQPHISNNQFPPMPPAPMKLDLEPPVVPIMASQYLNNTNFAPFAQENIKYGQPGPSVISSAPMPPAPMELEPPMVPNIAPAYHNQTNYEQPGPSNWDGLHHNGANFAIGEQDNIIYPEAGPSHSHELPPDVPLIRHWDVSVQLDQLPLFPSFGEHNMNGGEMGSFLQYEPGNEMEIPLQLAGPDCNRMPQPSAEQVFSDKGKRKASDSDLESESESGPKRFRASDFVHDDEHEEEAGVVE